MGDLTYSETADIETSSDDYAKRFAGPAGQWMLKKQESIVLEWMSTMRPGSTVLDVGGGHGQLAIPLSEAGLDVTVLGSSEACAGRLEPQLRSGKLKFQAGNIVDLPFPDRFFDVVVSIRLLAHCGQWQRLVSEMCRVTRKSVIVDYPVKKSFNAMSGALFDVKKKIEGNTRPYALFNNAEIVDEFEKNHFCLKSRQPQFFLPMVVHRILKSPAVSSGLEGICDVLGLTGLFGSPVLAEFRPQLTLYKKDLGKR